MALQEINIQSRTVQGSKRNGQPSGGATLVTGGTGNVQIDFPALFAEEMSRWFVRDTENKALRPADVGEEAYGLYSNSYISAKGANDAAGGTVSGVTELSELSDVQLGTLADGQVLTWDVSSQKWVNKTLETGLDETALADYLTRNQYVTQQWVTVALEQYVTTEDLTEAVAEAVSAALAGKVDTVFFARLLAAIAGDGTEISVNDMETVIASVKVKFGLWGDSWISAKGQNPDAGGTVSGATDLDGLSDVTLTNLQNGQVLMYNGSQWVNSTLDVGLDETALAQYLTSHLYATQSWVNSQNYATEADLDARIDALVNGAPAAFDTLKEIADVLQGNVDSIGDILTALGNKADKTITITAGTGLTGGGNLSANRTISLATVGTAGTYTKVTVDAYGRVTGHASLAATDIPNLPWSKITSGKPTTLAGYGITDAYTKTEADGRYVNVSGDTMTGTLHIKPTTGSYTEGIRLYGTKKDGSWSNINFGCDPSATSGTHTNQWILGRNSSNHFVLDRGNSTGASGFVVTTAGNMGIGTTSPSHKLHVVGGIYSSEYIQIGSGRIKWDSSNNALYVEKSDGTAIGFYSKGFISVKGANDDAGGSVSGVTALSQLSDVTLGTLANGQALVWNGSQWVNKTIESGLDETALAQYLTNNGYATQGWATSQFAYKTGTNASGTWPISISGSSVRITSTIYNSGSLASLTTAGRLYHAGGGNTVTDKPSGVDAFGLFTMQTASGWQGQILMSSNTATGLYWRTANNNFNGGWRTILDTTNYTSTLDSRYLRTVSLATISDLHSSWDAVLKAQKPAWLTTVSLATISDLHASWDALLKAAPTAYVTRWPAFSEVTGKPTTLGGYGITDGVNAVSVTGSGNAVTTANVSGHTLALTKGSTFALNTGTNASGTWPISISGSAAQLGGLTWSNFRIKRIYSISLSSLPTTNFYPIFFGLAYRELDCEINSPNLGGGADYNNNRIHFLISSAGWSDNGYSFVILSRSNYSDSEITIGAIGCGQRNGGVAVWVRGGMSYTVIANQTPSLKTSNYTNGEEIYTVGTNIYGGTNTYVSLAWQNTTSTYRHSTVVTNNSNPYFSSSIKIGSGTIYWDATNNCFHFSHGLYSDSFVSTKGANSGSGGTVSGVTKLSELSDVQLGTLATNQVLSWNGSKWVNKTLDMRLDETALAQYLTNNQYLTMPTGDGRYALKGGSNATGTWPISITGNAATATKLALQDTRSVNTAPFTGGEGLRYHFKQNTADGLNDGGTYHSVLQFNQWSEQSGGLCKQLALTDGGNMWFRTASSATAWGAWKKLLDSSNYAATLDTRYVKKAGDTMTGKLTINTTNYDDQLTIYRNNSNGNSVINYSNSSGILGRIGICGSAGTYPGQPCFNNGNNDYKIWTSGNDGSGSGLDADLLDGLQYTSFESYRVVQINASSLNQNTWYPVTMAIGNSQQTRIRIEGNTSANASWNPRADKYMSLILDYTVNGSMWGWTSAQRVIYQYMEGAGASACLRGLGQLTNSSTEYVFVRGGAVYNFYVSRFITPVLRTSTYTVSEQSVSPTTTAPAAISRTNALITDNVYSATQLQTARTINGTAFNGTSNIVTSYWGTARNFYIRDHDSSHTGAAVSVNGSANEYLLLPSTITASLNGNATSASYWQTARTLTVSGDATGSVSIRGNANMSLSLDVNYATSAGNADALDSLHASAFARETILSPQNLNADDLSNNWVMYYPSGDMNTWTSYSFTNFPSTKPEGGFFLWAVREGNYKRQFYTRYNDKHLYIRSTYYSGSVKWGSWGTLALTTDNVASATKLQTARSIWGQPFDGTAPVSGNMTGVGSITGSGSISMSGSITAGAYVYSSGWFQNQQSGEGLYNNAVDARWYATSGGWISDKKINANAGLGVSGTTTLGAAVQVPYSGSSWISMATRTNLIYSTTNNSQSSAHALFRVKAYNGNAICFGGLGNNVGFYAFTAANISSSTNVVWKNTYWDMTNWTLHHGGVLHCTGGIYSDSYVSAKGNNSSDARLKTDIHGFNATSILKRLKPKAFRWNSTAWGLSDAFKTDELQYGLIAQETKNVLPGIVVDNMFNDGYMGIRYDKLIPVLLQGEIETISRVETLEDKVRRLEKENGKLKKRIKELERRAA